MTERGLWVHLTQASPIPLAAALCCAPGEVLALVGPSGSGKSTILRCIAGLYRAREGRIVCNGAAWDDTARRVHLRPHQRRVGLVFQHYALFPHLTALENVMEALLDYPVHERRQRAAAWLTRVHLGGLEMRKPAALSGGQQQRVAVARALAREPEVLLLDEPFTSVDRATRERLYQELAELRRDWQMPVLLVTHDLEEAVLLADRLTILSHGRTLQTGGPVEVMTRPESVEVARLVGLKNIFEATVLEHVPERQQTRIAWRGRTLTAVLQPHFAPGHAVAWAIPASHVLLHRSPRALHGERDNPLTGIVAECLPLGERVAAIIHVEGRADTWLATTIPLHKARRQGLARGARVAVSLLAEGIHLMPLPKGSTAGG